MNRYLRGLTTAAALAFAASAFAGAAATTAASAQALGIHQATTTTIRPYATYTYRTSVTHGRVTRVSVTVVARFHLPGAPRSPETPIPANSARICEDDGAYTYQTCLTQNYLVCTPSGSTARLINLQSYVERWTMIDPSGTYQLKGPAGMRAGVNGGTNPAACGGSGGWYLNNQEKTISSPAPFNNYTFKPSWVGHYIRVNSTALFQCGNSYVQIYNYIHPAQTWTLLNPNVCQGTVGNWHW